MFVTETSCSSVVTLRLDANSWDMQQKSGTFQIVHWILIRINHCLRLESLFLQLIKALHRVQDRLNGSRSICWVSQLKPNENFFFIMLPSGCGTPAGILIGPSASNCFLSVWSGRGATTTAASSGTSLRARSLWLGTAWDTPRRTPTDTPVRRPPWRPAAH